MAINRFEVEFYTGGNGVPGRSVGGTNNSALTCTSHTSDSADTIAREKNKTEEVPYGLEALFLKPE